MNYFTTIILFFLTITNLLAQVSCDTIDFMEYPSTTFEENIYDEYLNCGALFLGSDSNHSAQVSHHPDQGGGMLHSQNWFRPIKIKFVNPYDSTQYNPSIQISYLSPTWPTEDYLLAKVYDINNNLIKQHTSFGADTVNLVFSSFKAAYIIFDDSLATSYSVDNISWTQSIVLSVDEIVDNQFRIYPNPTKSTLTINKKYLKSDLLNTQGQLIRTYYNQKVIDLSKLPDGLYIIRIDNDTHRIVKN